MAIQEMELTEGQELLLGRAKAATDAQIALARKIAYEQFGHDAKFPPQDVVMTIAQILATNYLASVTKANG
ncbi:hypothetical protein [Massilia varians]|uniref:hypothetical protein n=1 Tax=Massilia varians TaxID=457921 RepID=UPI002556B8F8|nr:hypothetical protein [Massilia varians]MDK6077905.1 hypothetical protein [Massilia varians]